MRTLRLKTYWAWFRKCLEYVFQSEIACVQEKQKLRRIDAIKVVKSNYPEKTQSNAQVAKNFVKER